MIIKTFFDYNEYTMDLSKGIDLSIAIHPNKGVNAFHIPEAKFEPIRVGSFIGSVAEGGSANCENLFINAHGNGTHTECVGHISKERICINDCLKKFHFYAQVISLTPSEKDNDHVIEIESINQLTRMPDVEALIIRTHPNTIEKKNKNYSGENPCYLSAELCEKIRLMGYKHLLIDLPSVDKEEDAGALAAHKSFWNYPAESALDMTITELIFVPDEVEEGIYFLNIGISSLMTDASPSKPIIYKMTKR